MRRWMAAAPAVLLATTGCLASKSDIRLIQDEMRATRSQLAVGDTSLLRADEARRAQIATLTAKIDRMNDSLRVLAGRLATFQATATGEFDSMGQQMVRVQALLGQNTKNVQETRAQLEALREQGTAPASAPPVASPGSGGAAGSDTTQRAAPGLPGPSTLFITAKDQLDNGAYVTARTGFQRLIDAYPTATDAPRALLYIGESYRAEGNTAAADSVYLLVPDRYPKAPEAATGLYKHGRILWDANNKAEARIVLNRLIRDYPNSDEAQLAKDLLNPRE
ncbi:MAG: tetratricopeptide repeat protein [Gemmatimonadales bacterium]